MIHDRSEANDVTALVERAETGEMPWRECLETIFNMEAGMLDQETYGMYGVSVEDKGVDMVIMVSGEGVTITDGVKEGVNVSVKIQSSDLAGILKVNIHQRKY